MARSGAASAAEPFVRRYNPFLDFESVVQVFRETCDGSLKVEPIWTIGGYIWCRPYLYLEEGNCFVLDNGGGKAVGYVIGTSSSERFCERWAAEFVPAVKAELNALPPIDASDDITAKSLDRRRQILLDLIHNNPRKLVFENLENELQAYPGHLHIDILPPFQRQGYGRQLIQAFLEAIKTKGCPGVFLGMVASNNVALHFYEALGFQRLPQVLNGGVSGELGRTSKESAGGESIYLVVEV